MKTNNRIDSNSFRNYTAYNPSSLHGDYWPTIARRKNTIFRHQKTRPISSLAIMLGRKDSNSALREEP